MRILLLSILCAAACGDNASPCDTRTTTYRGAVVSCGIETEGVCISNDCMPLCAVIGDRCATGEQWATIVVEGGEHVCYCEPVPGSVQTDN